MPAQLLKLPDIRQRDDFDCGAACVAAVLRFWGRVFPAVWSLPNPVQGTTPDTIEAVLRAAGLSVLSGSLTVSDLRHFAESGRPILCPVALRGGHWVVVRGVTGRRVYYHCPVDGESWVSGRDWDDLWADTSRTTSYLRWGIVPHA